MIVAGVVCALLETLLSPIPQGLGRRLRYVYFKRRLKHLGKGVVIDVGVRILNPQFVSIGDNTWIDNYAVILAGPPVEHGGPMKRQRNPRYAHAEGEVVIGRNCHIGMFVVLQGHGGLAIGDNCGVTSGCCLYSMSHHYANPDDPADGTVYTFSAMAAPASQSLLVSPVVMEDNSALGLNSVILPGGVIREAGWVGANSLVLGEIPPFSIAAGSPARVIKSRRR